MAVSPHHPVQWFHWSVLVWLWQQLAEAKGFSPWKEHHDPPQAGLLPQDPNVSCSYQLDIIEKNDPSNFCEQLPLHYSAAVIPYPQPLAWKPGLITKAAVPFLQVKEHTDVTFEGNPFKNIWPTPFTSEETYLKSVVIPTAYAPWCLVNNW